MRQAHLPPSDFVEHDHAILRNYMNGELTASFRLSRCGLVLRSLSVVSEARVSKRHTRARCACALSIQRLEGRRWRLRIPRIRGEEILHNVVVSKARKHT